MAFRRRLLPLRLTDGEVICPRKTAVVPAVIAVSTCKSMHDAGPGQCAAYSCGAYIKANAEVESLRKYAEGAKLMFPGSGLQEGKSDAEDTASGAV